MLQIILTLIALIFYFQEKKEISFVIILIIITNLLGFTDSYIIFYGFTIQNTDFGLIYLFLIIFYDKVILKIKYQVRYRDFSFFIIFILFLVTAIFIDLLINQTSMSDIFHTTRYWLFLLFIYPISIFSKKQIQKLFRHVFVLTIFNAVIYLFQFIIHNSIYFGELQNNITTQYSGAIRYRNVPPFLIFSIVFGILYLPFKKYIIPLIIFIGVVVQTLTRSLIFSLGVTLIGGSLLLSKKIKFKLIAIFLLLFLLFAITENQLLENRMSSGLDEIEYVFGGNSNIKTIGNFTYRINHFMERADYIVSTPTKLLFGMGFITENDFTIKLFTIGLTNDSGNIAQLDTADFAWSILIIRYGLLGTLIYLIAYFQIMTLFFRKKQFKIGLMGFYFLLINLILTFASSVITYAYFWIIPAFIYRYLQLSENEQ